MTEEERVEIRSVSLDDFAYEQKLKMIDMIKIDTEGFEPLVFRGAQRLLKAHRIRLFVFEHLLGNIHHLL